MPPKRASAGTAITIRGPDFSDGDPTHRPTKSNYVRSNEESFMQKVATRWMEEQGGVGKSGRTYTLSKLPDGYELWERPRPSQPNHVDRWLYGHPKHVTFDSPFRFYPHFKYLMRYDTGYGCPCEMCKKNKTSPSSSVAASTIAPKPRGRPSQRQALEKGPVDEEGTPDVYRSLFTLLRNEGRVTRQIEEKASLDWRAERPLVEIFASKVSKRSSFIPRQGEIVLYVRPSSPPFELHQDPTSGHVKAYDPLLEDFLDYPNWLAGIITQYPDSSTEISDLSPSLQPKTASASTNKDQLEGSSVNLNGFRIEPLPSLNSPDKNISKQHSYVPLHLIRPFCFWRTCLQGIPEQDWHESIHNALTCSSTVSLIDRHTFWGDWPDAEISSRGVYIGAESYWIGDTIRLMSSVGADTKLTLVIRIQNIITTFKNLQAEADGRTVTGNRCDDISISLIGPVYTIDFATAHHPEASLQDLTKPMRTYVKNGVPWQYFDRQGGILSTGFSCVLSRLYEEEAMRIWFPTIPPSQFIHLGRDDIIHARTIAAATDERIVDSPDGRTWYWGDCRAECLDIATANGLEVGNYDEERDPKVWREVLQVRDGQRGKVNAKGKQPSVKGMGMGEMVEKGVSSSDDEDEDEDAESSDELRQVDGADEDAMDGDADADELSPERKRVKVEISMPFRR